MSFSDVLAFFEASDDKGDGVISKESLASLMREIGFTGDVNRLLQVAAIDEDGEISYEEFLEWLSVDSEEDELAKLQATQGVLEDVQKKEARLHNEIEKLNADLAKAQTKGKRLKLNHKIRDKRKLLPFEANIHTGVENRFPGSSQILIQPDHASLPDGSRLLDRFRKVFEGLQGNSDCGVTPGRLEQALKSFSKSLPKEVATRINIVVADAFETIDVSRDGAIQWDEFEQWLHCRKVKDIRSEEAIATLFDLCDLNDDGMVSAEELMNVFLLVSRHMGTEGAGSRDEDQAQLTPEVAQAIVRDLDCDGSGGIKIFDFIQVIRAVTTEEQKESDSLDDSAPHLVLNFDVNNTVIMFDSATSSNIDNILSLVVSNAAWGKITYTTEGVPESWEAVGSELSPVSPVIGLKTYSEFVQEANPLPEGAPAADFKKIANQRRRLAWDFAKPGEPGFAFRPKLEELRKALLLPEGVKGTEKAMQAGLTGDFVNLLPGFLNFILDLKRTRRSFSLIFRTFGNDLDGVVQEINALCEGRHPYCSDDVVLDGSDGQPDHRARLRSAKGCGTFFRDPDKDFISLIMGTVEQPKSIEEGIGFYQSLQSVDVVVGQEAVSNCYAELCSLRGTLALRDYYPGWKQTNFKSCGGKPFFLDSMNDPSRFAIFFDDHITPACPKIVDPINPSQYERRYHISQLFGLHLVQAQPLFSILDPDYFVKTLRQCEAARQEKLKRWRLTKRLLGQLVDVCQLLDLFAGASSTDDLLKTNEQFTYIPWAEVELVRNSSTATTFEEADPNDLYSKEVLTLDREG